MPSSAVICSLGEARAFVIVLACKPSSTSTVVQLIAELKAVLCASAIAWRLPFIFRYYVSSHFVMQHARCCCMNVQRLRWIEGYAPSCDLHEPTYRFITLWTRPSTNSLASSLTNNKGTPLWKMIPESSALATPSISLSGRNHRETSLVNRSSVTKTSSCVWP